MFNLKLRELWLSYRPFYILYTLLDSEKDSLRVLIIMFHHGYSIGATYGENQKMHGESFTYGMELIRNHDGIFHRSLLDDY